MIQSSLRISINNREVWLNFNIKTMNNDDFVTYVHITYRPEHEVKKLTFLCCITRQIQKVICAYYPVTTVPSDSI